MKYIQMPLIGQRTFTTHGPIAETVRVSCGSIASWPALADRWPTSAMPRKADAKSGHWHRTRWTRTDVGFVRDCLFVEPQPTCESIQRLTRHIQSIDRRLLIQIAARHPTGHHLLRTEAQLLGNYGLETHERNLWTRCQAADLRGEHQSLQEQTIVKPAVLR